MFKLLYTEEAKKRIARFDERLKLKVKQGLEEIANHPEVGKPLTRELKGRYSYRVQDYRIIYRMDRTQIVILILTVGHRRAVYAKMSRKHL